MPFSRTNAAVNMLNNAPGVNSRVGLRRRRRLGERAAARRRRHPRSRGRHRLDVLQLQHHRPSRRSAASASRPSTAASPARWSTRSPSRAATRSRALPEYRYTEQGPARRQHQQHESRREPDAAGQPAPISCKDYTVQLGGPLKRDKAFFFGSIQRYAVQGRPGTARARSHRGQPALQRQAHLPADDERHLLGERPVRPVQPDRPVQLPGALTTARPTQLTHRAGLARVHLERLLPQGDWRLVVLRGEVHRLLGLLRPRPDDALAGATRRRRHVVRAALATAPKYDRLRNQVNASFNRYLEAGGTHNFKFGVEIERSKIRNRQPTPTMFTTTTSAGSRTWPTATATTSRAPTSGRAPTSRTSGRSAA